MPLLFRLHNSISQRDTLNILRNGNCLIYPSVIHDIFIPENITRLQNEWNYRLKVLRHQASGQKPITEYFWVFSKILTDEGHSSWHYPLEHRSAPITIIREWTKFILMRVLGDHIRTCMYIIIEHLIMLCYSEWSCSRAIAARVCFIRPVDQSRPSRPPPDYFRRILNTKLKYSTLAILPFHFTTLSQPPYNSQWKREHPDIGRTPCTCAFFSQLQLELTFFFFKLLKLVSRTEKPIACSLVFTQWSQSRIICTQCVICELFCSVTAFPVDNNKVRPLKC